MTLQPGTQWKPTCSADGIYMEEICCRCEHDSAFQDGTGDSCEIAASMYAIGHNPAWLIGLDGLPFCKSYRREGAGYRCPFTPDMFRSAPSILSKGESPAHKVKADE